MALIVEKLHAHLILAAVLLLLSAMVYGLRKCRGNRGTALLRWRRPCCGCCWYCCCAKGSKIPGHGRTVAVD
ncbi:hypothetical protein O0544_19115 [Edwardsiella anguillarum]|nr:hypothetical protein [Edwardsiella anguillarum]